MSLLVEAPRRRPGQQRGRMRCGYTATAGAQYAAGGGVEMKLDATIPIALLATTGGTPVEAPFAIACEGSARFFHSSTNAPSTPTGLQVFVIDIANRKITRALEPRQEFDPICGADGVSGKADISPGIVNAWSFKRGESGDTETCSFEVDRKSGKAKYELNLEYPSGAFDRFDWQMTCVPTRIPVFDTSGNKF